MREVLFSEGTYQIEVGEGVWPFLQVSDQGTVIDGFCSCDEGGMCSHLRAAMGKVLEKGPPLHVYFREYFWNLLCQIGARRHGYDPKCLVKEKGAFFCESASGKRVFYLKARTERGETVLEEMLFKRVVETEETSLKFSNLPSDELGLWKGGTPTFGLQYELSFWADLAKYLLLGTCETIRYRLGSDGLPNGVMGEFEDLEVGIYVAKVNWPELIPALKSVKSPLKVHEFRDVAVEKIVYSPEKKGFLITSKKGKGKLEEMNQGIPMGDYVFVPSRGFFPKAIDPIFKRSEIPTSLVAKVLDHHLDILLKFLRGTKVHRERQPLSYHLAFDDEDQLHIQAYLLEVGDVEALFGDWIYVKKKGFFPASGLEFDQLEVVIPNRRLSDFVSTHRHWLNQFSGFNTHITSVEARISYELDDEGLSFAAKTKLTEEEGGVIDAGDWVYLEGKGFYSKLSARGKLSFSSDMHVAKEDISTFIRMHTEELEQVKGFFAPECPIEEGGLEVKLSGSSIVVSPKFTFDEGKEAIFYGDYTYVEGEGFSEIPPLFRVPHKYQNPVKISAKKEAYFITCELAKLRPNIIALDPKLVAPEELDLRLLDLERDGTHLVAKVVYESDIGTESIGPVHKALSKDKAYLSSKAGLILFKDTRFNWLRTVPKERIVDGGKRVRLSYLEWLRLNVFEEIGAPRSKEAKELIADLENFGSSEPINTQGLKSSLRPYQETGLKWLWFLYTYELSGLLCDDMGLGKTHQAMALISAVRNQERGAKFLVVCPTSVIYHWEDLLEKFLPEIKVCIYYGVGREVRPDFELLITTYGTLRSDRVALSEIDFSVAIYDELQNAKNPSSQTHRSLTMMQAKMRVGLSGTPIENRLTELKALFDIILPNYFPKDSIYREQFVHPIEKENDKASKALLTKMIHPFLLRRKKGEVLQDLPEKIEEINHTILSPEQKFLYKEAYDNSKKAIYDELEGKDGKVFLHVFALLNHLKQVCNHPALITGGKYHQHQCGKWDLFIELLSEIRDSGQKVVIFSQYLGMLDLIQNYLDDHNIGYATIRGSTRNRKEMLTKFKTDPKCEVFVASLKAVGVGVDLVSASVVIHYDRWWNPAKENQATDRVHRIGQNRGVQVFKLVTKDTVEEHIDHLIQKKLALSEGIIGYDSETDLKQLTREELRSLLDQIGDDIG